MEARTEIAKKEAEKEHLSRKISRKHKVFDFGSFDPKYVKIETRRIKQQMKIVVTVDGKPKGV